MHVCMKRVAVSYQFHRKVFPMVQYTITQHFFFFQIMTWHRTGYKLLSEPMMASFASDCIPHSAQWDPSGRHMVRLLWVRSLNYILPLLSSTCMLYNDRLYRNTVFTQLFIQAQIKENIKAPRRWPLCGGIHRRPVNSMNKWPVTWKKCFHWWRHHGDCIQPWADTA